MQLFEVNDIPDNISIATFSGRVVSASSTTISAIGCKLDLNQQCFISTTEGDLEAQVIGVDNNKAILLPFEPYHSISIGDRVTPSKSKPTIKVSDQWLGRVVNAKGEAIDNKGELLGVDVLDIYNQQSSPSMNRKPITEVLDVGVRSINSLLTLGQGQRVGLIAGPGIGKSILLGMMTKFTEADVIIVGLIGERGREVREFINDTLGEEGMTKAIVVASPANESPLMRIQATHLCHSLASYFRDKGKNVLLLVDSLTRFAMAQREVAIALGDLPVIKGYPASVMNHIPQLLERSGNGDENSGSMSAIYTLLSEGDEGDYDPVVDSAKAILDGHIRLSKELAQEGHYPAIDIEASISRCMTNIVSPPHSECAREVKRLYSVYQKSKDLLSLGAYKGGNDPDIDQAILKHKDINTLLKQAMSEAISLEQSVNDLAAIFQQRS
ncbi:FliI/YscN family ATPase [Vibrio sp.]|nr:FliI/YscN family ATPase [Vibrio sp.]